MVQAYVFLIIGRSCVFGRFCFKLCYGLRFGQQVNGFEAQACKLGLLVSVNAGFGFGCLLVWLEMFELNGKVFECLFRLVLQVQQAWPF